MAECPSVCEHLHLPGPVGRRRGAPPDGPPVHGRALPRARGADPRGRARHRAHDRRHRRVLRRDRGPVRERRSTCSRRSRYDQVFAAAFSPRPGTPAARLPDDVPPAEKRRRLNELLELQEGIGLRAQPSVGRADDRGPVERESRRRGPRARRRPGRAERESLRRRPFADLPATVRSSSSAARGRASSSTLAGGRSLVGRFVTARIEHAGALRAPARPSPPATTPAARRHRRRDRDRQDRASLRLADG